MLVYECVKVTYWVYKKNLQFMHCNFTVFLASLWLFVYNICVQMVSKSAYYIINYILVRLEDTNALKLNIGFCKTKSNSSWLNLQNYL